MAGRKQTIDLAAVVRSYYRARKGGNAVSLLRQLLAAEMRDFCEETRVADAAFAAGATDWKWRNRGNLDSLLAQIEAQYSALGGDDRDAARETLFELANHLDDLHDKLAAIARTQPVDGADDTPPPAAAAHAAPKATPTGNPHIAALAPVVSITQLRATRALAALGRLPKAA